MYFYGVVLLVLSVTRLVTSFNLKWTPVLEISQGKLRGVAETTHNKYLGIPYAKVEKRFQEATAFPPWKNIFFAIKDKNCKQVLPVLKLPYGTEDCLILNVYTPSNATRENSVPVMVYIHGGGFNFGGSSSLFFGPEPLVERGVAVVTFTYRLGAAGFLCLDLEEAPGNVGLKDQITALKWVKENINAFGGDPTSVTVFGESAGATSAHLMVFSKMAEGLFHRAILESNTGLSAITFSFDPIQKASQVADRLGYTTKDPHQLLEIYQNTSLTDIVLATDSDELLEKFNFVPCAEKEFPSTEAFITNTPYEILSSGNYTKVPMMIGHNEKEGTVFVGMFKDLEYEKYSRNYEYFLPRDLNFTSRKDMLRWGRIVREFYFGNKTYIRDDTEKIIELVSDAYFHYSNVKASEMHIDTSDQPLYNYYYTYESERNIGHAFSRLPAIKGPTHFDETFYLFNPSIRIRPLTGRDLIMANRMAELWTNFAKTSNPTPRRTELLPNLWLPSDSGGLQFYTLDDDMHMRDLPNKKRINLWRRIYDKFGYKKAS